MSKKLIPVDKKQCQAEQAEGCHPTATNFMVLGPAQWVRCKNKPIWIATQKKPNKEDSRIGKMSLCDDCRKILIKKLGKNYASFTSI